MEDVGICICPFGLFTAVWCVGIFGHLVCVFYGYLVYFVPFWYQEKSGNPVPNQEQDQEQSKIFST
jgi:hypothetical protein